MNFIYPLFLAGLAALSIPIIIHLFNFRRIKRIYFTNVQFLKEVKQQTAARNKIKHLLVLLMRMLAIASLVLAFAQPYLPKSTDTIVTGTKAVSVYIDNSFSMNALSNDVSLFEKGRQKAREIIAAYSPEDRFQIISNDFEGKHQRMLNKDEFNSYLDELSISPKTQTLDKVISRQKQAMAMANAVQKNVFIISDFQKNIASFENDTNLNIFLVPLQSVEQQNVYVDSVWFDSPLRMLNESSNLMVKITNTGNNAVENSRLSLRLNKEVKAIKDFSVPAQSSVIDTLNFTITQAGSQQAEAIINDYPITFDDSYYFTFDVAERVDILAINQTTVSPYLNALFKNSGNFTLANQTVGQLDYKSIPNFQLIILNQLNEISTGLATELQQYVNNGGSLLIFPSENINLTSYNNFCKQLKISSFGEINKNQQEIDYINTQQEVFKDVFSKIPQNMDLPYTRFAYTINSFSNSGEETILRYKQGNSFLSKYNAGNGKVYTCASPLDIKSTNLPSHSIFVPLLYKIALLGGKIRPLAYTIGKGETVEVDANNYAKENVFKLKNEQREFIPEQKVIGSKLLINANNQIKEAGIYKLFMDELKPLTNIGFNYNRQESILQYLNIDKLKELYTAKNITFLNNTNSDLSIKVGEIDKGIVLWQWCLIAALIFLFMEVILLRFWK